MNRILPPWSRPRAALLAAIGAAAIVAVVAAAALVAHEAAAGASTAAPSARPRVWIDYPPDGATYAVGDTVPVRWHASHPAGLQSVRILVGEEELATDDDLGPDTMTTRRHVWLPAEPGAYLLRVEASATDGGTAALTREIFVAGDASPKPAAPRTPPPTAAAATPSPAATARPRTPPPGATPSPAASLTPEPTSSPTPPAPHTPTQSPIPPSPTAAPTGTPTPDVQPPPAPSQVAPIGGTELGCGATVLLTWLPTDDPSGDQSYTVALEQKVTATTWAPVNVYVVLGPSKNLTSVVDCGVIYRWRVRARDEAGNTGPYSGWAQFGIALP